MEILNKYTTIEEIVNKGLDQEDRKITLSISEEEAVKFAEDLEEDSIFVPEYKGPEFKYDKYNLDYIGIQGISLLLKVNK